MKKLRKNKFVVLAICVIVVSLVYWGIQKAIDEYNFEEVEVIEVTDNENNEIQQEDVAIGEESEPAEVSEEEMDEPRKIYVYITGEVNLPGVIILNEGSRIVDAINAAGGTTSKANISKVNLVYVLEDGMKVNIPNDNDLQNTVSFEYITIDSGEGANDSSGYESISEGHSQYSIVNINTATQTELETLPGIGPSIALKIINYRKEKGKFSSIEDIKNVSGIGDNKFENIKKYITI